MHFHHQFFRIKPGLTNLQGDIGPLHGLFEQWVTADEDWRQTQVYVECCKKEGTITSDARDWLTIAQVKAMLGEDGGTSMIKYLEENEAEKCRDHPDAPNIKDS